MRNAEDGAQIRQVVRFISSNKLRRAKQALFSLADGVEQEYRSLRLRLFPGDNVTERYIFLDGVTDEERSIDLVLETISGKSVYFLDVGANFGLFSLLAAKNCKEGSKIIAVEPNPSLQDRIKDNLKRNKLTRRVRIAPYAIAEEKGEAALHIKATNLGRATLRDNDRQAVDGSISVPTRPITDFLPKKNDFDLSILKIDVEGFEDRALAPLLNSDFGFDALLIETRHSSQWNVDVHAALLSRGYEEIFSGEGNAFLVRSSD